MPLLVWKLIARMAKHLLLGSNTLDSIPGDHALAGKVLPFEEQPLGILLRRNPIAQLIHTHRVRIYFAPL
jgi:hypothetical protein